MCRRSQIECRYRKASFRNAILHYRIENWIEESTSIECQATIETEAPIEYQARIETEAATLRSPSFVRGLSSAEMKASLEFIQRLFW